MGSGPVPPETEVIIEIVSGSIFHLAAVELIANHPQLALDQVGKAYVNGGYSLPLRAEPTALHYNQVGDSVQIAISGVGFEELTHIQGMRANGLRPLLLNANVVADTLVTCALPIADAEMLQSVMLSSAGGGRAEFELDSLVSLPFWRPTEILVSITVDAPPQLHQTLQDNGAQQVDTKAPSPIMQADPGRFEDLNTLYRIRIPLGVPANQMLADFQAQPGVLHASLVMGGPTPAAPNDDPLWYTQWPLHQVDVPLCSGTLHPVANSSLDMPSVWRRYLQGNTVVPVAVIDTGIDDSQQDLNPIGSSEPGASFAPLDADPYVDAGFGLLRYGHGTSLAGLIAAIGHNGTFDEGGLTGGIAGVAPGAVPVSIKWWGTNNGSIDSFFAALAYARSRPITIISLAFQ
ncbi:MAG: S8 family serine peptidase, partial [Devosia sp.]